jgi:exonuclease VII small subunit
MMLPKKDKSVEEEKYNPINALKPVSMAFRPYKVPNSEEKEILIVSHHTSSSNISSNGEPKKTRKRRRLPCERDLSPETFRKTRNKRLAKESRQRKNAYIKSLEQKVSELEEKIIDLNEKLESYKKKVSLLEINDSRGHENLSTAQEYWHTQLSEEINKNSTSRSHLKSIVEYFVATLGVAGSDRK